MAKITFNNKQTAVNPSQPQSPLETFSADDVNEIKASVNTLYDTVNLLESSGVTQTQLNLKVDKDGNKVLSDTNYTQAEKNKLNSISSGATINSTDSALRDRTTHTGTQAISTITNLQTELNVIVNKVDKDGVKVLSDINFSTVKDSKLASIASGATVNDSDANLKNRINHTGTQAISTITNLQTELDSKLSGNISANIINSGILGDARLSSNVVVFSGGTSSQYVKGDKTLGTLDKSSVGLSNVDNTSDLAKPVSTATQTAISNKVDKDGSKVLSDVNFSTAKDSKLAGIAIAATANDSDVNLKNRANHTGTQTADTITDGITNKVFTTTEKTKLSGIAVGATVNDTDVNLKNRANHTGTQAISTITNLQTELDSKATSVSITAAVANKVDKDGTKVLSDVNFSTAKDSKLSSIASGATVNDSDVNLRNRTTHTGTQAISTITGLQTELDSKLSGNISANIINSGTLSDARLSTNVLLLSGGTSSQYVRGDKTLATLDKSTISLGNVDNTSDANKPVSTAQATAIALKANLASPTFTGVPVAPTAAPGTNTTQIATTAFVLANAGSGGSGSTTTNASLLTSGTLADARLSSNVLLISGGTSSQYIRGDKTLATLDKSVIGLSNVDNTSDANKPISTATQTALNLKVNNDGSKVLSDVNFSTAKDSKLASIASGATVNSLDSALRDRSTHTGTQAISTITSLQTILDSLSSGSSGSAVVNYYVDPILGNDNNTGLNANQAWGTLAKISATNFIVPTKIQLKAGSSFTGQIVIGSGSTASVILTTYGGKDKAIINKPVDFNGIEVIDKGDFTIENIIVDCTSSNIYDVTSGIGIYSELPIVSNFKIRNCEVRNCNTYAIAIGVGGTSGNKMNNLHIHDCLIYGNANGIFTYGVNDDEYSIENVLIERVKAYDNLGLFTTTWTHTGSGIIAGGLKNAIIQNCEAYNNGQNNNGESGGPFGIWTYNSNGVIIQFCSSHDNKTSTGREDGGGFDIDGGCKNCVIQYCDSYNNYGPGFMLCEFGSPNLSEKNLIRENTSRNDGRAGQKGALAIHGYVTNAVFRDNKIYFDLTGQVGGTAPVVFATYNPIMEGIVIRDNEFYLGDSLTLNSLGLTTDKILFKNNRVKNLTNTEIISDSDYTTLEKNKLASIASGATVNSTDSALRDRTSHTGMQAISTITNLQTELDSKVALINLEEALPEMTPEQLVIQLGPALLQFLSDNGFTPSGPGLTPLSQSTVTFGTSSTTSNVVNWSSVTNATSYNLNRSSSSGMTSSVSLYTGTGLTFTDTGLTSNTTYYYRVTASASGYTSSNSTIVNKTTNDEPVVGQGELVPKFIARGSGTTNLTQSAGEVTTNTTGLEIVCANEVDTAGSTLQIVSIETGYHPSQIDGHAYTIGFLPFNENFGATVFNVNKIDSAIEYQLDNGSGVSVGYDLPDLETSKWRARAVKGTTFWEFYVETSTDSGATWTNRNSGGSPIVSTYEIENELYGTVGCFPSGVTFPNVRFDVEVVEPTTVAVNNWITEDAVATGNNLTPDAPETLARAGSMTYIDPGTNGFVQMRSNGGNIGLSEVAPDFYLPSDNEMRQWILRTVAQGKALTYERPNIFFSDEIQGRDINTLMRLRLETTVVHYEYSIDAGVSWISVKTPSPRFDARLYIVSGLYGGSVLDIVQSGFTTA